MSYQFTIEQQNSDTLARTGTIKTQKGLIQTPVFMPVGTNICVKTLDTQDLVALNPDIILSNTYHNFLRPGDEVVARRGGLHGFMKWEKPMLTDSGGFQIFSLESLRKISEEGVKFQSHIDGTSFFWTPEKVIEIQKNLGADIIMPLDVCSALPSDHKKLLEAAQISLLWLDRSLSVERLPYQSIHGIVQGGTDPKLRTFSAKETCERACDGFSIGGLSVGEAQQEMLDTVSICTEILPLNKPRYLMGVGTPLDIVESVDRGVDMFDCVMPTRNARNGTLFTSLGRVQIRKSIYREVDDPIDPACKCHTCLHYSAAYLHHLFKAQEYTAMRLNTIHNLYYYLNLMKRIRQAIVQGEYAAFVRNFRTSNEAGSFS